MFIPSWMRLVRSTRSDPTFERWAFEQLELPTRANILELGANTGQFWYENRDRIPLSWNVEVTDTDPLVLDIARKRLRKLRPQVTVSPLDIFKLRHCPKQYDAIICNHLFHLMPFELRLYVLEDIWNCLAPNGILITGTCGIQDLEEVRKLFLDLDHGLELYDQNKFPCFCVENGRAILERHFSEVLVREYSARLEIDDADLLVDAARRQSRSINDFLVNEASRAYRDYLAQMIRHRGPLLATRHAGLFLCKK